MRVNTPLSFCILDLDHFKIINDTYGHQAGDMVLKKFTHLCSSIVRSSDVVVRLGGEEFGVLLPSTNMQEAKILAERVRKELQAQTLTLETHQAFNVTVSIGVAEFNPERHKDEHIDLIGLADKALYKAKQSGRNKVVCSIAT